jgi:hypothetical protein
VRRFRSSLIHYGISVTNFGSGYQAFSVIRIAHRPRIRPEGGTPNGLEYRVYAVYLGLKARFDMTETRFGDRIMLRLWRGVEA